MVSSEAAAAESAERAVSVRRRWLVLVGSLAIGMAAAFGLGSAVKSTSATTTTSGSLQPTVAAGGNGATVLALNGSAAIPALKAQPKPKAKTTQSSTSTGSQASGATPTVSVQPTQAQPTQAQPTQAQPTQQQTQAPPPQTTTGLQSGGG